MKPLLLVALAAAVAQLPAQSPITSTFVGGFVVTNTNPPPTTELFDITITDPAGVTFQQMDVLLNLSAGTSGAFSVFVTAAGGTHVGNQTNAAVWTQVATAPVTHNGGTVPVTLPTPFYLAPGTYGMALYYVGMNAVYSNPTSAGLPNTYSTAEVTLDMTSARVRSSDLTSAFGGTAAGFAPRHANVRMFYVSGAAAVDFTGTPTTGSSPLAVQFTSYAASANPGGIIAYQWDFGDGNQSSAVNPSHTYTTCGDYTVSLTIVDSVGALVATKTNFITTDVVRPAFSNALIAPLTVQFTDLSTGGPQTWAWDFDNDGITDSTVQNPVWSFASACAEAVVTLTTTRACKTATLTKRVAVATTLETTFQSGLIISATATGGTNFIDVDVGNPLGITVCGMHVNSNMGAGLPITVNVWQKAGTYIGAVEDATKWRLVGTATANSLGGGGRTFLSFAPPIHLAFGTSGLGIEQVGSSPVYTNLGGTVSYSNADATITAGMTQLSPIFGPAATSTQFTPRIWNGALEYSTTTTNGAAGYGYIGAGCPGSLGTPRNVATSQPIIGTTSNWQVDRLPFDIGIMALGLARIPAVDLTFLGMPGCPLHVTADVTLTIVGTGNQAMLAFPIPNSVSFVGFQIYSQALSLDPALNAFGFSISDAAVALLGQ